MDEYILIAVFRYNDDHTLKPYTILHKAHCMGRIQEASHKIWCENDILSVEFGPALDVS